MALLCFEKIVSTSNIWYECACREAGMMCVMGRGNVYQRLEKKKRKEWQEKRKKIDTCIFINKY